MKNSLHLYKSYKFDTKSFYDLANLLRLYKAFKLKTKLFYDLATYLRLYEAFKLETKTFCDLTTLLRLYEASRLDLMYTPSSNSSFSLLTLLIYKIIKSILTRVFKIVFDFIQSIFEV